MATASEPAPFAPVEVRRVDVAADGSLAAVVEPSRIDIVALPSRELIGEIGVGGDADIAWVGARLIVLVREPAYTAVHLVDPRGAHGPAAISEIRLEAAVHLRASCGSYALAATPRGAVVLAVGDANVTPFPLPSRTSPLAAGAAGTQFLLALSSAIEEWDPPSRTPRRRFKLPRPAAITAIGGSERSVWLATQQDPARVDVIALVQRGQPKAHELPEPIAAIAAHPRSDTIACLGGTSGRIYAIDLDGRAGSNVAVLDGVERADRIALVVGRGTSVLAARAGEPLALVALDARDGDATLPPPLWTAPSRPRKAAEPAPPSTLVGEPIAEATPQRSTLGHDEPDEPMSGGQAPASGGQAPMSGGQAPMSGGQASTSGGQAPMSGGQASTSGGQASMSGGPALTSGGQVSMSGGQVSMSGGPALTSGGPAPTSGGQDPTSGVRAVAADNPPPTLSVLQRNESPWGRIATRPSDLAAGGERALEADATWRDEAVAWVRAGQGKPPVAPPIDALASAFGVPTLAPALILLYGAHLAGSDGAAPVDVARVTGRRWDEALGRGRLAAAGLAIYRASRVHLAPAVQRALDELPPTTGTLVGSAGESSLLGPCVVVANSDEQLVAVAARVLPLVGGAIFAARTGVDPSELLFEARAYAATPLLRATAMVGNDTVIYVVSSDEQADTIGLPRL